MKIVENEQIVCFDVDDTLVKWTDRYTQPHENALDFNDPYDNSTNYLAPHKAHVALLKKFKGRGYYIRVWSAGGVKWAESVVNRLKLNSYVDSVETKPIKIVDDLPPNEFLYRLYLKDL